MIVAAMPRELRPLARALSLRAATVDGLRAWQPASGATPVAVCIGVGMERARRATERVVTAVRPDAVLVVGVAGAVSGDLGVGDVVAPAQVVDASTGTAYAPTWTLDCASGRARVGALATVDRFGSPLPPHAVAVDMETAAVAAVCDEHGVPWDVRRAVSDVPGAVTPEVAGLLRADGRADLGAVAGLLVRRPAEVVRLVRLGRSTSRAVAAATGSALELVAAASGER